MNKILVTGGAGYIGAHIVHLLSKQNNLVVVVDNLINGQLENLKTNQNVIFIKADIIDKDKIENILDEYQFNTIIHLAALKSISKSNLEVDSYTQTNIVGSINLISLAVKYNVEKFIFSSTAAVYGDVDEKLIDELHTTSPINHYGFTKLYIENYLKWISSIQNIKYVSFRFFNAAGYNMNEGVIKKREKHAENLLPVILESFKDKNLLLKVFGNDYPTNDGTCIRDYIHVQDIALAHIKAISYLEENESNIFNLSTGIGHSVLEIIGKIETLIGKKLNYEISNRRDGDPSILVASNNKAKTILGWSPKYTIDDIVLSMLKFYNNE